MRFSPRMRWMTVALGVAATTMALVAAVPVTSSAGERKQVTTDYTLIRNVPKAYHRDVLPR